jgi:hypothetical protein
VFSQPSLMFAGKIRAYLIEAPSCAPLWGRLLPLPINIILGSKGPSGTNTNLLQNFVNYGYKKLNSLSPIWGQSHKTFLVLVYVLFFGKLDLFLDMQQIQGILKGEVWLYCWPPVKLVWNQLYDNLQFLFLFAKQAYQKKSKRRSMVQRYFPL